MKAARDNDIERHDGLYLPLRKRHGRSNRLHNGVWRRKFRFVSDTYLLSYILKFAYQKGESRP